MAPRVAAGAFLSRRRWLVAGAVLAPLWALAAWLLTDTVVPGGLRLPSVDAKAVFGAHLVSSAHRYERFFYLTWIAEQVVRVGTLWLYARRGASFLRESAAGPIGSGMLLGMLGFGIVWLTGVPFQIVNLWWARRHDVTDEGYLLAVFGGWLSLGATFLTVSIALLVVMFLARLIGSFWWIPGAAVFTGLIAALVLVSPYIAPQGTRTSLAHVDPALVRSAERYEADQGVGGITFEVEEVSDRTNAANAYATGLGGTRHIFLWDTLLDGDFTRAEEEVVLAHEIAHHSSNHLWEGIWWFGLFAAPGAYLLMLVTRRRGGMGAPEAVPVALLVTAVYYLALTPVQTLVTRRMEAEADWKALESTHDPKAMRALMQGLGESSLGDPEPPGWARILFEDHPPLARRVAMAEAWAARNR